MQNILWKAVFKNGEIVQEEKNGEYFNFTELNKENLICFSVRNINNNSVYTINLITGQFLINGIPVAPSLQYNSLDIDCICCKKLNYSSGLFWYNQMTTDINLNGRTSQTQLQYTYFGYQVSINQDFNFNGFNGKIIKARPMIKIQSNNNRVTISNQFLFQYYNQSGQRNLVRF